MFVFPENSYVEILIPSVVVFGGGALVEVFKSWAWRPHEWGYCSYKRDPTELPSLHVRIE